jgi:GNAT superfamily N-acetyltransferase
MVPERRSMHVRRLGSEDASLFMSLRRAALEDAPCAFGSSPEDDRAASIDFVRDALASPDRATFGAFAGELVDIVGVYRDRSAKGAHKCSIWGLYVSPDARSNGIGRALVTEALGFARPLEGVTQVPVCATDRAPRPGPCTRAWASSRGASKRLPFESAISRSRSTTWSGRSMVTLPNQRVEQTGPRSRMKNKACWTGTSCG